MKQFSKVFLSLLCLVFLSFSFAGCTKAENAKLIDISDKYTQIYKSYDKDNGQIFYGSSFNPSYTTNLSLIISTDTTGVYNVLNSSTSTENFSGRGAYAILMQSVNSTYLNNNALTILKNNDLTEKKYKKAMYEALESLQKNVKTLKTNKKSLENIFDNDNRDAEIVSKQDLTIYNLNRYKNSLNLCLKDLLKFNKNYSLALVNNITKPVTLDDLLYNHTSVAVTKEYNNQLINTANILLSNYVLSYDLDILNDVNDKDMINLLTKLLDLQLGLKDETVTEAETINKYKNIRTMEDSASKLEVSFENCIKTLNNKNYLEEKNKETIKFVENYKISLINYANKLVSYLENL